MARKLSDIKEEKIKTRMGVRIEAHIIYRMQACFQSVCLYCVELWDCDAALEEEIGSILK